MGEPFGGRDETRFILGLTSLVAAASNQVGVSWTDEAQSLLADHARSRLEKADLHSMPSEFLGFDNQAPDNFIDVLDPAVLVAFNFGRAAAALTPDAIEGTEVTKSTLFAWLPKLCPPPIPPFC